MSKVAPCPVTGCWFWLGMLGADGYGSVWIGGTRANGGRLFRAHRASYEEFVGPIPEGMVLDHLCRQRSCINPDHLQPVTNKVNLLRGNTIAARNAAKTHCKNGHELIPENLRRVKGRGRICKVCSRKRSTHSLSGEHRA